MEETVTRNTVVYLTYTIWDQDGNLFEQYDLPVGYVHGVNGPLFEKIEQALEGCVSATRSRSCCCRRTVSAITNPS